MKDMFIMLLLLTGITGQAVWAEDQPADSSATTTPPADTTPDTGTGSEAPGEGQTKEEEEPDCE